MSAPDLQALQRRMKVRAEYLKSGDRYDAAGELEVWIVEIGTAFAEAALKAAPPLDELADIEQMWGKDIVETFEVVEYKPATPPAAALPLPSADLTRLREAVDAYLANLQDTQSPIDKLFAGRVVTLACEWRAALLTDAPAAQHDTVAYLVALGSSPPQWWTGRGDEWTDTVDGTHLNPSRSAMRFARREDAERAIGWLLEKTLARGCKVEEHLWL